jgi:hypothetical protein
MVFLGLAGGCWKGPAGVAQLPVPQVVIQPVAVTLTGGKTQRFSARVETGQAAPLRWRVVEPNGGSVDAAGTYRAPRTPGTYTVEAGVQGGVGAAARVTVVAPPAGEIQAPARVLPGATGVTARIAKVPGSTYAWTVAGGLVTGGEDTEAVTFEAGAGPKVLLRSRVTNAAGDVLNSSLELPVAAPVSLAISPREVTLTAGRGMKFGYTLEGGISLKVAWSLGEPGAGSLDGTGRYVAPPAPGFYTVRVTAKDDPTRFAIARVKVVEKPPESLTVPASFSPGARNLRASMPEVAGITYAWELYGGTLTAGAGSHAVTFTAGAGPELTVRCRATNEAGDSFLASKVLKAEAN